LNSGVVTIAIKVVEPKPFVAQTSTDQNLID
jgi:hypothetical protein